MSRCYYLDYRSSGVFSSANGKYVCRLCKQEFAPDSLQVHFTCNSDSGDANAQYWLGLIAANKSERLAWWTKAAEDRNAEAMQGLYGDMSFAGYDPEKQKAYLLKALNVKPAPMDNGFDNEYARAASLLRAWFQLKNTNSPSESNVENAAYCAVIAAVLDRDYADRLSEFAIRQSQFDAWAVDARNYNFHLPC